MQFAAIALFAASALAYTNVTTTAADVYVTEVVTELTTYCPESTTLTVNGKTYTVTEATTLTITDCPCTITHSTKPAASSTVSSESAVPTFPENGAANAGVAGLAAVAGVAAFLL